MIYSPYAKYQDSGINWLGEMPEHWDIVKGGYIGTFFGTEPISDESILKEGRIPYLKVSSLSNVGFEIESWEWFVAPQVEHQVKPRSRYVVFPKRGAAIFLNKVNVVDMPSLIDPNLMGWELNSTVIPLFIAYVLKTRKLDELADVSTVPQINNKHISPERFPVPPIDEQIVIVNFLDHETAKIDTLIEKQEQLIKLLEEKRQAVISHAVTKGLNPDVPMKDSCVEWLGDVPEHWGIKKFNHVARIENGQVDPRDEPYCNYVLIAPNHIQSGTGKLLYTETAKEQGADSGKYLCKHGEVVYSKIRPALAKVVICREQIALCSADMYPISSTEPLTNSFLFWFMLSRSFTDAAILDSDRVAMPKINRDTLGQYKICCPPSTEQEAISLHIEAVVLKIDNLRREAKRAMELMSERRTALISAAVTGKIDVREAV